MTWEVTGMLRKFKELHGEYISRIEGQERLAFAMSDNEDLYDLIAWAEHGGYQGSVIRFYDFATSEVYTPFEKKRDVLYGKPEFFDGYYYFLQGDYGEKRITLYKYLPQGMTSTLDKLESPDTADLPQVLEPVTTFGVDEVDLYNLSVAGNGVHVISQDDTFHCYFPERFSFPLTPQETVCFLDDGKVYIEAWVEEGWDNENDCAGENYEFYHLVRVKDYEGNLLSEERGYLHRAEDGTWWMA